MANNLQKIHFILFFSFLMVLIISQNNYGQNYIPYNINPDINFGKINSGYIIMDENKDYSGDKETFCYNYIKKNYNINSLKRFYFFSKFKSEFAPYTNYDIGDKFNIASSSEIINSEVIGYTICRPIEILRFYTVLSGVNNITEQDNFDYNHIHVLLCSQKKIYNTINYEKITDDNLIAKITKKVLAKTKKVKTKKMRKEDTYTEISAFKGNFINSGNQEYVVSYHKVTDIELCISYLVIVNENGDILKDVSPILNVGQHYICLGTIDYDSDGKDEIIVDEGYYEGGSDILVGYNGSYFEIIAQGFNDGL